MSNGNDLMQYSVEEPEDSYIEVDAHELPPLWEFQSWDTPNSYHRFLEYFLSQKPPRTIIEAYRKFRLATGWTSEKVMSLKNTPGAWYNWAYARDGRGKVIPGAKGWGARAAAYDRYLTHESFRAEAEMWRDRRAKIREQEFDMGQKLIGRAERMLAAVLFEREELKSETSADGKTIIHHHVYKPADWSERDIANFMKIASDLLRRSADMEAKRIGVDWRSELAQQNPSVDPDEIFENAVASVLARLTAGDGSVSDGSVDGSPKAAA
jgi:hypothetical protein